MSSGALEIVLEFARAEQTDDPFAFRFGSQAYLMPTPRGGGGYGRSELVWDSARLARLQAVRRPGRDPALVQEIGEQGPFTPMHRRTSQGWRGASPASGPCRIAMTTDSRSPEDPVPGMSSAPLEADAAAIAPSAAVAKVDEMAKDVASRADRARAAAEARAAAQQERASSVASERQAAAERRAVEMVEARVRKLIARNKELQEKLSKGPGRRK